MSNIDQLKRDIAVLPDLERAELARFVIDSLEDDGTDAGTGDDWREELRRRVSEIRNGTVEGISAGDVFARLDEKYG